MVEGNRKQKEREDKDYEHLEKQEDRRKKKSNGRRWLNRREGVRRGVKDGDDEIKEMTGRNEGLGFTDE